MSRWDKLWRWFDDQMGSVREMSRTINDSGQAEMIYENGHLEVKVKGILKSVTINGKRLEVKVNEKV